MTSKRIWHKGPPPHVGWWNASLFQDKEVFRWWNGKCWGLDANQRMPLHLLITVATVNAHSDSQHRIMWTTYWPKNARVPRIKP